MLHRVALVRTDVSKESFASITRLKRIKELGTLAVISNVGSYTLSHPRKRHSLNSPKWKPQILHSINQLGSVAEIYLFPAKCELGFHIPEDLRLWRWLWRMLHNHLHNLKSYNVSKLSSQLMLSEEILVYPQNLLRTSRGPILTREHNLGSSQL
jgi:hypothetical protein